jgi:hypothetical protein
MEFEAGTMKSPVSWDITPSIFYKITSISEEPGVSIFIHDRRATKMSEKW